MSDNDQISALPALGIVVGVLAFVFKCCDFIEVMPSF